MVEQSVRRNRALKALQIAAQLGDDHKEALATLKLVRQAYGASLGECGASWGLLMPKLAVAASVALVALGVFELGENLIDAHSALHSLLVSAAHAAP